MLLKDFYVYKQFRHSVKPCAGITPIFHISYYKKPVKEAGSCLQKAERPVGEHFNIAYAVYINTYSQPDLFAVKLKCG